MSQSSSTTDTNFTRKDVSYLALLILLASLLHGWLIAHTEVLARDGAGFVRYALRLEREPWREVIRSSHQHPLYPATILATSLPIRSLYGTTPETMRLSAQLAAGLAGVLLVVPMYSLGRTLFDRRVGFWSAVLFQCLPVTARMLSDALSDALCLFLVASALALGGRALRTASPWRFALCGVFGGLAYLTRPEGILPVAVVGLVWLGMQVRGVERSSVRRFSACAAALIVGALLAGGPLIAVTGRLSTKPAADAMLRNDAPALSAVPAAVTEARPAVDDGPSTANVAPAPSPGAAPTSASTPRSALGKSLWALGSILVRDFQWVGWLPALVSLWYFRASLWRQPEAWVLVLLCLLFGAALVRLNMVAGYLGERHAQMLVMCGSFGAVAVTAVLGDRLARLGHRRWLAPVLLAALTLCGLPVLGKPLHANQAGYRSAGLWLAAHAQPEDEIFDWHDSAKYYAGRLYPDRAASALSITYAVVEEPQRNPLPADVQQRIDALKRQGAVVFRCPADSNRAKGHEIVIYASHPPWGAVAAVDPRR